MPKQRSVKGYNDQIDFARSVITIQEFTCNGGMAVLEGSKGVLFKNGKTYTFLTEKCNCCGYQLEVYRIPKKQIQKFFKLI